MEFKINHEAIPSSEPICSVVQEQGVELDYILPDYCPDIFRIIRCEIIPVITDRSVSGEKLSYELRCTVRLIYSPENDACDIRCITIRQEFGKSLDLGSSPISPVIAITPRTDRVNCRAVSKRRLDIRGSVSVGIEVTGQTSREVISDAFGMNLHLKKLPLKYAADRLTAEKLIRLSDDTELSSTQPPVSAILRTQCSVSGCEKKIVSGKLLVKGDITLNMLYSHSRGIEPFQHSIPFSQIIDMNGLDENFGCIADTEITDIDVSVSEDKIGENRLLRIEPELHISCTAVRQAEVMIAADAYSTVYPCETTSETIRAEQLPRVFTESFAVTSVIAEGSDVPRNIFAMWCDTKNISAHTDGSSVVVSGMLTCSMAAEDGSGNIIMPDHDEAFEERLDLGCDMSGADVAIKLTNCDISYNIGSDGKLTARAELTAEIRSGSSGSITALTDITVDDSVRKQRDGDYAFKLRCCREHEDIWDIAKQCSTSAEAIMEENDLSDTCLENGGMLVIPIVE